MECAICFQKPSEKYPFYSYIPCNDGFICALCILKQYHFRKENKCPFCFNKWEFVILTVKPVDYKAPLISNPHFPTKTTSGPSSHERVSQTNGGICSSSLIFTSEFSNKNKTSTKLSPRDAYINSIEAGLASVDIKETTSSSILPDSMQSEEYAIYVKSNLPANDQSVGQDSKPVLHEQRSSSSPPAATSKNAYLTTSTFNNSECVLSCGSQTKKELSEQRGLPEVALNPQEALLSRYPVLEEGSPFRYRSEAESFFFRKIRRPHCKKCPALPPFSSHKGLQGHLLEKHNIYFCRICSENLFCFAPEWTYFTTLANLNVHKNKDHPTCRICLKRFFDNNTFKLHLYDKHSTCQYCLHNRPGSSYFVNAELLRDHMLFNHFLCERGACKNNLQFVTFRFELDYKVHVLKEHKEDLSKEELNEMMLLSSGKTMPKLGRLRREEDGLASALEEENAIRTRPRRPVPSLRLDSVTRVENEHIPEGRASGSRRVVRLERLHTSVEDQKGYNKSSLWESERSRVSGGNYITRKDRASKKLRNNDVAKPGALYRMAPVRSNESGEKPNVAHKMERPSFRKPLEPLSNKGKEKSTNPSNLSLSSEKEGGKKERPDESYDALLSKRKEEKIKLFQSLQSSFQNFRFLSLREIPFSVSRDLILFEGLLEVPINIEIMDLLLRINADKLEPAVGENLKSLFFSWYCTHKNYLQTKEVIETKISRFYDSIKFFFKSNDNLEEKKGVLIENQNLLFNELGSFKIGKRGWLDIMKAEKEFIMGRSLKLGTPEKEIGEFFGSLSIGGELYSSLSSSLFSKTQMEQLVNKLGLTNGYRLFIRLGALIVKETDEFLFNKWVYLNFLK